MASPLQLSSEEFEEICLGEEESVLDDGSRDKPQRWLFCKHCEQTVSKSTYYRHRDECVQRYTEEAYEKEFDEFVDDGETGEEQFDDFVCTDDAFMEDDSREEIVSTGADNELLVDASSTTNDMVRLLGTTETLQNALGSVHFEPPTMLNFRP